jgi:hypothetical protein
MIELATRAYLQEEWSNISSGFQDLSLMQTWEYAEAKAEMGPWRVWRATFVDGELVVGAVQALVRPIPRLGGGLVWINRGPLWRRSANVDPSLLVLMMEELRHHWVEQQHMYLRIAPPIWEAEGELNACERTGCRQVDGSVGWASARLDLSLTIEALRSHLQQKWRNCLNKAERIGFTAQCGSDSVVFHELLASYKTMLQEKQFQTNITPPFLCRLQESLPPGRKLWSFIGRHNEQVLGGILIATYGDTCEYLVGAINEAGRALNAGQFWLWQSVCQMKTLGYRWFDLGGMDPQHTPPGIFHFKAGLGGTPYRLVREFEADDGGWRSRVIRWYVSRVRKATGG